VNLKKRPMYENVRSNNPPCLNHKFSIIVKKQARTSTYIPLQRYGIIAYATFFVKKKQFQFFGAL